MKKNRRRIAIACAVVFVYLLLVNAILFPVVFPEGLTEKFVDLRSEPLNLFHILAFAVTAILLTCIMVIRRGHSQSLLDGATTGGLLGLFVALPEHLHLYAMVDASAVKQFIPVIWILATWGIAGLLVHLIVYCRRDDDPGDGFEYNTRKTGN